MAFSSVAGLLAAAKDRPLWRAVLEDDLRDRGVEEAHSWAQMSALWTAMKAPAEVAQQIDVGQVQPVLQQGGEKDVRNADIEIDDPIFVHGFAPFQNE